MTTNLYTVDQDRFPKTPSAQWPARMGAGVTPSDTVDLAPYARALYIGVAGDVTVVHAGDRSLSGVGTPVLYKAHPVGYMPVQVRRVMATGTAATNINALYDD